MIDGKMDNKTPYQDPATGMWYNVVNRDSTLRSGTNVNKLESSGSALMAYAMMKLYVDEDIDEKYGQAGLQAFNGTVSTKMKNGALTDVYRSSDVKTNDEAYLGSTYETNEAKGVGPLMMAAVYANAAAEKFNKADPEWTQPTAKTGLTDNDNNQALVTEGTTEHGTYYVWYRLKGDCAHNDAGPFCVTVQIAKAAQTAPAAPEAEASTINSITLKPTEGYEYSMDGQTWQKSNVFTDLTMDTEYTFYQRAAGDANHESSPASAAQKLKQCRTFTIGNTQPKARP